MSGLASVELMHARRHPWFIAWLWFVQIVLGLVLVWPLVSVVRQTYGGHPLGDRVLFADGGYELLDFVARELPNMAPALVGHAVVILVLSFAVRIIAFGATFGMIASPEAQHGRFRERLGVALRQSVARTVALAIQSFLALVAQAIAIGLAIALVGGLSVALADRMGVPNAGRVAVISALPLLVLALSFGVVRDVAGARAIVDGERTFQAIGRSARAFVRRPVFLVEYGWRALAGLAVVGLGLLVTSRLGGRPGGALVVVFAIHQIALALRVALRVSWLASVVRRTR